MQSTGSGTAGTREGATDAPPPPPTLGSVGASDFFWRMGKRVESIWRDRNLNERAFPEVAMEVLAQTPPSAHLHWLDVVEEFFIPTEERHGWPLQRDVDFGEPPLMLYRSDRFFIEMLCWMEGTTGLHQHGFSGAFHVLAGSSIHSQYVFHEKRRVSAALLIGDLELQGVELLKQGDTRPISSGRNFIHSLFHLDQPSITVVVRTENEPGSYPQYNYLRPHLAEDGFSKDETLKKQNKLLFTLGRADRAAFERIVTTFVQQTHFHAAWQALQAAHLLYGEGEFFTRLMDEARRVHGGIVDLLPRVMAERRWREHLVGLRKTVVEPDLRFFLALLLNVPDRVSLQRCVAERYGDDPRREIMSWIRRLTRTDNEGNVVCMNLFYPALLPALPIRLAAEPFFVLIEGLLEGRSIDAIKKRLTHDFPPAQVEAGAERIKSTVTQMASSALCPLVLPLNA